MIYREFCMRLDWEDLVYSMVYGFVWGFSAPKLWLAM